MTFSPVTLVKAEYTRLSAKQPELNKSEEKDKKEHRLWLINQYNILTNLFRYVFSFIDFMHFHLMLQLATR